MDIVEGRQAKKFVRLAIWLLRKKLGDAVIPERIHSDLISCGNPLIAHIAVTLNNAADQINSPYQRTTVRELGELGLWILNRDTAYRDVFAWIINELLADSEEIKKEIEHLVKEPKEWYPNAWVDSKKHTKDARKKKKIPPYQKTADEDIFTPTTQDRKLSRL